MPIHTYVIGHYNLSVRITTKLPITLLFCVLILSSRAYSLNSTMNERFLRSFFMVILFILTVCTRYQVKGIPWRNIFIFSFWCLTWGLSSGLTSNKLIHYILDYGDFNIFSMWYSSPIGKLPIARLKTVLIESMLAYLFDKPCHLNLFIIIS